MVPGSNAGQGGGDLPASRGFVPGMRGGAGGGGNMAEPDLPASRGFRPGMTDQDEGEKAAPDVLSSAAALPLTNTETPWKLGGGAGSSDGNRSGGDKKTGYAPGKDGEKIPSANSETGGPNVMKAG